MPTTLPSRPKHRKVEPETLALMFASLMLLSVLGLVCHKFYPSPPGYSLGARASELQLSP
ncbi:MAG TPA: hypothetical protein VHD34_02410 [Xanthobacteraceae bacterium]|nr:hypothetical protein [Xanthobacteraceae bacterium]